MLKLPFTKYPSFGKDNPEYAYACGRIKALEIRLFDRVRFERLASTKDFEELLKTLQDTEYSVYLNEIHKPSDYEVMLKKELEKLYTLVSELAVEKELIKDLRIPYDFLNLKILVKSVIFEQDFSQYCSRFSYYPVSLLKHFVESGKDGFLDPRLTVAFELAVSSYYEKKEVFRIDAVIDREMFRYFAESRFEFLRIFYKIKADLLNILTFIRLERLKRQNLIKIFKLPEGYLPDELFYSVPDSQTLLYEIRHTPYFAVLDPGYQYYLKTGQFTKMEKHINNYLNGLVKEASKKDLGVEPVISYFMRKKNEINLLRMIIVSKINDLPKEEILERIPEVV